MSTRGVATGPSALARAAAVGEAHGGADPRPELVLRVAFGSPDVARAAWARLEPVLDIDTIAHDCHGVFGQLAAALRRLDAGGRLLPRLDGVRKRLWTRSSLRVREVLDARGALQAAGVCAEPAGGLAVLLRQPDLGLRPLVDAELAVEPAQAQEALRVLAEQGWRETGRRRDGWLMDLHAVTLARAGHELTLRWCDRPWPYADGARAREVLGEQVRLPGAADLLVYTVAEGHRLWGYTPTRRDADALMLLADAEGVDARRVAELARQRGAVTLLRQTVARLADLTAAHSDASAALLDQLGGSAPSARQRWALAADRRSGTVAVMLRRTDALGPVDALAAGPGILREIWDVPAGDTLSMTVVRRVGRRLTGPRGPSARR